MYILLLFLNMLRLLSQTTDCSLSELIVSDSNNVENPVFFSKIQRKLGEYSANNLKARFLNSPPYSKGNPILRDENKFTQLITASTTGFWVWNTHTILNQGYMEDVKFQVHLNQKISTSIVQKHVDNSYAGLIW